MTKMSNYLFNYNIITMAKKSVIIGEYVVTIEDTGTVSVSQIYKSTMQAMREMAALKGMEVPSNWNNHYLGKKLLDTYCGPEAQSGVIGEYSIERQPNGHIDVIRTFSNTKASLRLISDLIGYKYENKWDTRTLGNKLVEYVEANKDSIKIAKPAKTQKKDAETGAPAAADDNHAPGGEVNSASQHFDLVIPLKYHYAFEFSGGFAKVSKKVDYSDKWGFIDQTGKEVIPLIYDDVDHNFLEGLVAVEKDDKWGFVDQTGKEVIPLIYDFAGRFSDGLAVVKKDGKYGFIDRTGKEVIPISLIYDYVSHFSEGLAAVSKDGKYGYIDRTGKEVIPFIYDYANSFSDGLAIVQVRVKKRDTYGVIDRTGKEVIPLIYDYVYDFKDGLAEVKNRTKYGYIDQTGKEVIPSIYQEVGSFSEGLFAVKKDDKWGYVGKVEK